MSGSRSIAGITISNSTMSGSDAAGTEIGTITVTMSDGSAFDGTLTLSGPYSLYFTVSRTRDPYSISALSLDNYTLGANPAVGTKVGTLSVVMSDDSAFAGTFAVDDTTHFRITGSDITTAVVVNSGQTYPITVTASDPGATNQNLSRTFQISVQAGLAVPGPLTNITSPSQDTASITVAWAPPTAGGVCDVGVHQIQYKAVADSTWLNAPTVRYCTSGHGSFTDAYNNTWSLNASNHPVINTTVDTNSNAAILYLVSGTVWQQDTLGAWWGTTPSGTINVAPPWTPGTSPLQLTLTGLANGTTYNVRGSASNSAGSGSPSTPVNFATQAVQPGGGVGPAASSPFLTVEFQSAQNYPTTSTQQVVSQRMYGVYIGWGGDSGGGRGPDTRCFSAYSNSTWTSQMALVNPGVHMITGNLGSEGADWFDGNQNVNTGNWANLINNFYKVDPLGISGIILGMNFSKFSTSQYATAFENFAKYIEGPAGMMPNGKRLPLIGFGSHNEPNDANTAANYFNAYMPRVKAVNPNYVCIGPQYADGNGGIIQTFLANTNPKPDGISWDFFPGGGTSQSYGTSYYTGNLSHCFDGTCQAIRGLLPGGYTPKMVLPGGNSNWGCAAQDQNTINGAMFWAANWYNGLSTSAWPLWVAAWDDGGQGSCGIVSAQDSSWPISPGGYMYGIGVRNVFGPRWQTPTNSGGLRVIATTPTSSRVGVMIINGGAGGKSGTVALSHWPVNTTGNATVNMWQMTNSVQGNGQDGTRSQVSVSAGVTPSINFPDPSVTVLYV